MSKSCFSAIFSRPGGRRRSSATSSPTDTVAIWGAGPVGQFAIRSAVLLGAKQVISIDRLPERLGMASAGGATTINFAQESVVERLNELTDGKGPEKCIDAVGLEAHATATVDSMYDRAKQALMLETDRPHVLREMMYVCRPAGTLSVPGVYGGLLDKIPFGAFMNKGLTMRTGQTHVNRWTDDLLAPHRGRPDRPVFRHHPPGQARRGAANVQDLPRQGRWLHQGRADPVNRGAAMADNDQDRLSGADGRSTGTAMAVARGLGWFSIGLGLVEALSPGIVTRAIGMEGKEGLVRGYGVREIGTGIGILAANDPSPWLWGRVAGDALDLAALATALRADPERKRNVILALAAVAGVTAIDAACAQALGGTRPVASAQPFRDYSERSGMPRPVESMRGAAGISRCRATCEPRKRCAPTPAGSRPSNWPSSLTGPSERRWRPGAFSGNLPASGVRRALPPNELPLYSLLHARDR